jgi:NIMA (never in mitosis gene a)-related kinase
MIYHILKGLALLHNHQVLHRDLKSANIFISNGVYKIGDLNVSKVISDQKLVKTQTGTPYYASPEVWRDELYDHKSDIWSLGCIIYEMCTFRPPFLGESLEDLNRSVQKGRFQPIPSQYSKELQELISKCLSLSPR